MVLANTLALAAAAVAINIWHFVRVVQLRFSEKIIHGDGGNAALQRRIRAQLNFIEHAPLFLILFGLVEFLGKGGQWLAIAGIVFVIARISHAIGMDSEKANPLRAAGMMTAILLEVVLVVTAVLILLGRI